MKIINMVDPIEPLCIYCNQQTNNVGETLCYEHCDEYRHERNAKKAQKIRLNLKPMRQDEFRNLETTHVCPYCMDEIDEYGACCGEAGHGEKAYMDVRGETLTENEFFDKYEVVDTLPDDNEDAHKDEPEYLEER